MLEKEPEKRHNLNQLEKEWKNLLNNAYGKHIEIKDSVGGGSFLISRLLSRLLTG